MKLRRVLSLLMVFLLTAVLTAGCGSKTKTTETQPAAEGTSSETASEGSGEAAPAQTEAEAVTLKVWAPEAEQEVTAEMVEMFKKNHPEYNLEIQIGVMSVADSIDEIKKDAEVAADVFSFPSSGIPELVDAGLILPITVDLDTIKSIHSESAIKGCSLNDLLYGIPQSPNSWFMYYDKSKYTEEEVKSLETMMAKDLGEDVKNFSCDIDNSWYMSAFFYANGGTLYGANGDDPAECSWNDEKGYKAAEYLMDLVNNSKYVDDQDGLAGSLMKEGKLAAMCSGTWAAADIQAALGDNYAATKLPSIKIDGTDYQLSNFADFRAVGVNSASKYPKAAQQLAAWLGGEESQLLRFQKVDSTAPTIKSLLENDEIKSNIAVLALSTQVTYSTPNPSTSQLSQYWTPASAFGAGIVNGDITKDNLQENLDSMVDGFLSTLVSE